MILEQNTTLEDIKSSDKLIVYHSCSTKDLNSRFINNPNKNIHAGTLLQAVYRADYKINDEGLYTTSYIHQIHLNINDLYPNLVKDDGGNSNSFMEDTYKSNWNLLVYKNVAEGHIENQNLSVIILNKSIIEKVEYHSEWDNEKIEKYLYHLYN